MTDGVESTEVKGEESEGGGRFIPLLKASTELIDTNAFELEDAFKSFLRVALKAGVELLHPPFNLALLEHLVETNNALAPCIEAMEVNIDGSGAEITPKEGTTGDGADRVNDFFNEVSPGKSFMSVRRALRRDLESIGNAYLEPQRSLAGELVFLRQVEGKMVRLVRLDEPVEVERTITRGGKEMKVTMFVRERRYAQVIGPKLVYFKEFKASRDLDKTTGKWGTDENPVPAEKQATELIHFKMLKDATTPYGVPRWMSQLPSVLGSRQAEEENLQFFSRGGLPPILIIVDGGKLAPKVKEAIEDALNRKKDKHRAAIIEVHNTGGNLEKGGGSGSVKTTVHRFGSEQVKDSMFENYDKRSFERVRGAFRLPPIFVGRVEDFNFATAFASYTVAEAQVFAPERAEFDEVVNNLIMPEIGGENFTYRSLPVSVNDIRFQLEAIALANGVNAIDRKQLIKSLNEVTGLDLEVSKEEEVPLITDADMVTDPDGNVVSISQGKTPAGPEGSGPEGATPGAPAATAKVHVVKADMAALLKLANAADKALRGGLRGNAAGAFQALAKEVGMLSEVDSATFRALLAARYFSHPDDDPEGLGEIAACAVDILSAR